MFLKQLKYFQILKKGTLCFSHFSSKNYVCDNRVYIGQSKHGILSIKKGGGEKTDQEKKINISRKSWHR